MTVSQYLRKRGISLSELSRRARVHKSVLHNLKNGGTCNGPNADKIIKATGGEVTLPELVGSVVPAPGEA